MQQEKAQGEKATIFLQTQHKMPFGELYSKLVHLLKNTSKIYNHTSIFF